MCVCVCGGGGGGGELPSALYQEVFVFSLSNVTENVVVNGLKLAGLDNRKASRNCRILYTQSVWQFQLELISSMNSSAA